ncbi:hypothetical protein JHK82_033771 [Glycine max]|nr:hypothetical protein JHK85_034487 [Glycine max]KAG5119351.1 hypothetical protein JHK82_033771 [Glycine max]KAG5140344.1 hypothetical protein JHK84_034112 [Glycine max]
MAAIFRELLMKVLPKLLMVWISKLYSFLFVQLLFVYAVRDNIIDPVKDEPSHAPTLLLKLATKLIFKVSSAKAFNITISSFWLCVRAATLMGSLFPFLITVPLRNCFVTSIIALILIDLPKKFPFDSPHPTKPHTASTIHFATIFILKLIGMSYTQTQRKGSSIDPLSPPEDLSSNNSTLIHVHHLQPFIMLSGNDGSEFLPAIPKKEITIIHTKNEATIHIEHFFDIKYLEGISLNMNEPMLRYGIRGFYNHFQTIHPKLIGRFWRYVEFQNAYAIVSDVVGNKVTFSWRPLLKSLDD